MYLNGGEERLKSPPARTMAPFLPNSPQNRFSKLLVLKTFSLCFKKWRLLVLAAALRRNGTYVAICTGLGSMFYK